MSLVNRPILDQTGRRILITGTRGLAYFAAMELARAGANVIIAGRDAVNGMETVEAIRRQVPSALIGFEYVDLASLDSVAELASRFENGGALDVLVNNAGIMSPPQRKTTIDGYELQFGVNYLSHFALTGRLLSSLRRSQSPRVVSVTSLAHRHGKLNFKDLQREQDYRPGEAYCQSKLAQALFTRELQRRSDAAGWSLKSLGAHPGYAKTNLFSNEQGSRSVLNIVGTYIVGPLIGQSAAGGAQPVIEAATTPGATGGELYGPTGRFEMKGPPGRVEFGPKALDNAVAERLWQLSEELTGVCYA